MNESVVKWLSKVVGYSYFSLFHSMPKLRKSSEDRATPQRLNGPYPAPAVLADDDLLKEITALKANMSDLFRRIHNCMPKQVCGRHNAEHVAKV